MGSGNYHWGRRDFVKGVCPCLKGETLKGEEGLNKAGSRRCNDSQ
jgi:hypothetical protein